MERNKQKKTTTSISTDGGYRLWHSLTGNKLPQEIKKKYIQHIVAGKDKGPLQSSNANFPKKKKKEKYTTIRKKIKNNNWAPSKIRLRLGAEVDKNYNNSKS